MSHTAYGQSELVFSVRTNDPLSPIRSRNPSISSDRDREAISLYDGSEYSNYTYQSSSIANATSPTSLSNDIWSPLDSPIDEELMFSPFPRNEYYMTDGKTSGFYPSPDEQPIKSERRFFGDGRIYSGRGLDRTYSERLREVSERIPPMGLTRAVPSHVRSRRRESESTDDSAMIRNPAHGIP